MTDEPRRSAAQRLLDDWSTDQREREMLIESRPGIGRAEIDAILASRGLRQPEVTIRRISSARGSRPG